MINQRNIEFIDLLILLKILEIFSNKAADIYGIKNL